MPDSKCCTKCGEVKPLSEFYKDSHAPDGHRSECKTCSKSSQLKRRAANREKVRAQARARYAADPEKVRAQKRAWYAADPDKANQPRKDRMALDPFYRLRNKAQVEVYEARKRGDLVRPDRCSECGAIGPVEGHHEDYFKPLDVIWLCRPCHTKRHRLDPELHDLRAKHGFPPYVDPLS